MAIEEGPEMNIIPGETPGQIEQEACVLAQKSSRIDELGKKLLALETFSTNTISPFELPQTKIQIPPDISAILHEWYQGQYSPTPEQIDNAIKSIRTKRDALQKSLPQSVVATTKKRTVGHEEGIQQKVKPRRLVQKLQGFVSVLKEQVELALRDHPELASTLSLLEESLTRASDSTTSDEQLKEIRIKIELSLLRLPKPTATALLEFLVTLPGETQTAIPQGFHDFVNQFLRLDTLRPLLTSRKPSFESWEQLTDLEEVIKNFIRLNAREEALQWYVVYSKIKSQTGNLRGSSGIVTSVLNRERPGLRDCIKGLIQYQSIYSQGPNPSFLGKLGAYALTVGIEVLPLFYNSFQTTKHKRNEKELCQDFVKMCGTTHDLRNIWEFLSHNLVSPISHSHVLKTLLPFFQNEKALQELTQFPERIGNDWRSLVFIDLCRKDTAAVKKRATELSVSNSDLADFVEDFSKGLLSQGKIEEALQLSDAMTTNFYRVSIQLDLFNYLFNEAALPKQNLPNTRLFDFIQQKIREQESLIEKLISPLEENPEAALRNFNATDFILYGFFRVAQSHAKDQPPSISQEQQQQINDLQTRHQVTKQRSLIVQEPLFTHAFNRLSSALPKTQEEVKRFIDDCARIEQNFASLPNCSTRIDELKKRGILNSLSLKYEELSQRLTLMHISNSEEVEKWRQECSVLEGNCMNIKSKEYPNLPWKDELDDLEMKTDNLLTSCSVLMLRPDYDLMAQQVDTLPLDHAAIMSFLKKCIKDWNLFKDLPPEKKNELPEHFQENMHTFMQRGFTRYEELMASERLQNIENLSLAPPITGLVDFANKLFEALRTIDESTKALGLEPPQLTGLREQIWARIREGVEQYYLLHFQKLQQEAQSLPNEEQALEPFLRTVRMWHHQLYTVSGSLGRQGLWLVDGTEVAQKAADLRLLAKRKLPKEAKNPLFASLSFDPQHFKTGLGAIVDAPPFSPNSRPLHEYANELWQTVSTASEFNPLEMLRMVQQGEGELPPATPPSKEQATTELKRRWDTFIQTIENNITRYGENSQQAQKTYNTITRYLVPIFEKLLEKKDQTLNQKILKEYIEASTHCLTRYLEVAQLYYSSVCLGQQRDPQQSMYSLCAEMRDACIGELLNKNYLGDVHARNAIKVDLGKELGLPGYQSALQEDVHRGVAIGIGYRPQDVREEFSLEYTPETLVSNFLIDRLKRDSDELVCYFRLYEELFPLTDEELPLATEYKAIKALAPEEQTEALQNMRDRLHVPDETRSHAFSRYIREIGLLQQRLEVLKADLTEKYDISSLQGEEKKKAKEDAKTEWEKRSADLAKDVCTKLSIKTEVTTEDLAHWNRQMRDIVTLPNAQKEEAINALFATHPDIFICTHIENEKVIQGALADEHQDAITNKLLDSEDTPRIEPLIAVLQKIHVFEKPATTTEPT